jgi:threonine dehydratase
MGAIAFSDIQQAAARLHRIAYVTPVLTLPQLDEATGSAVWLKCENFQRIGAFKFRGAYNAVAALPPESRSSPVVTLSSGNHAQGVALACQLLGRQAHVVMPQPINAFKLAAVVRYGAIVHQARDRHEGECMLKALLDELSGVHVHAFNDPFVIAGQGTAMLEFLSAVPDLDVVLAPIGGGGLLAGTCLAAHTLKPSLELYACEPAGALDALYAVQENRIVPMDDPRTIAEGLRTSLGDLTLPILRKHLSGFFSVKEQEIVSALRFAFERLKLVIEPASAVALAPLLRQEPVLRGKRIGVLVTGGNVDLSAWWASVS